MIEEHIKELKKRARKIFKIKKKKLKCEIKYDLNSRRTLGMFCKIGKEKYFRFNKKIIEINKEKYLSVVEHEFGHLIVSIIHKKEKVLPHGKEWKEVMRALGAKEIGATTKEFKEEVKEAYKGNLIECECKCQKHYLTKAKVNKMVLENVKFKCVKCDKEVKVIK